MTAPAALCGTACPDHPHTCARSPQHYGDHRDVKQKGNETCSWPDPPAPRPAGPSVAATRAAAREALRGLTGGHPTPQWRVVWTDDEYPTDIGPVCEDPDHEPTDSSAYDCCPQPVIEVGDEALAAYLVALLNADRTEAAPDFFQPGHTYSNGTGYTAPELITLFCVEHITRHPNRGTLRAIGWMRSGAPDSGWHGHFQDEGEFEGWTEHLTGGDAR